MRLYAVVIGRRPEHKPYVAYADNRGTALGIYEKKSQAQALKFELLKAAGQMPGDIFVRRIDVKI